MKKFTVKNEYGITGETRHNTAVAALKAASKREGTGWIVVDDAGNRWDYGADCETAVKIDTF